ncbi:unnamed protein product [Vitrella brassicaformis CCMP3155]|uniref:Uncharacterized protein n=1 Tax=Vitrella brassicaformis (strain CCMP3155) TaxID=1169540 RepID=A0A0G4H4Q3_VITBC|nr:unnamed protein product [Vitrella brassicaformis CCMP3155]|mmetsp:Transcript_13420/g.38673  ORF Transcript_13420/g.38673 Transcript_13420/m.38673 type:complete len:307 (+) Transcript_13420:102-1022(+)|eukprot:CEM38775.1 unnamed protein product [Vitrella brassicaformis CCMP3155]
MACPLRRYPYRDRTPSDRLLDIVQLRSDLLDKRESDLKSRYELIDENTSLRRYNKILEDEVDELEAENSRLANRFRTALALEDQATSSARKLNDEVDTLRKTVTDLSDSNTGLRHENRRLRYAVDCVGKPLCWSGIGPVGGGVYVETIQWRVTGMTRKLRSIPMYSAITSPILSSARLGLFKVEFDFYPNGAAGAPPRACTVVFRCDKGVTLKFQLFVGSKRTIPIEYTFTGYGGYRHDFKKVRDEVELDDTLLVGVDILECCTWASPICPPAACALPPTTCALAPPYCTYRPRSCALGRKYLTDL